MVTEVKSKINVSVKLQFKNNKFIRGNSSSKGIMLTLDSTKNKWILSWSSDVGLVERRTAMRQARSIAASGFSDGKSNRIGLGRPLEMAGEKEIPNRLLHDQHKY